MTSPAFLDTTVIVDLIIKEHDRRDAVAKINEAIGPGFRLGCSFSKLEFKRALIQNLGLLLDYVVQEGYTAAYQRATRFQSKRKISTLVNVLAWAGQSVDVVPTEIRAGDRFDQHLTRQAKVFLRNAIGVLWHRFDVIVNTTTDRTKCMRAREVPRQKATGSFDLTIHESKCADRTCANEDFLRSNLPKIRAVLSRLDDLASMQDGLTDELRKCRAMLQQAVADPSLLYDYQNCLDVGDLWIHLEALAAGVINFVTTNFKESKVLCPALGLNMIVPKVEG
jgi:hypothetical protein